jgi:hypothetical protein
MGTSPMNDEEKAARLVTIAERVRGIYERASSARLEFTKFVAEARELLGSDEELLAWMAREGDLELMVSYERERNPSVEMRF